MEGVGGLMVVMVVLGLIIGILWILMPFAIFESKPLLRELIAEQRKTNVLLQAQVDRARSGPTL